MNIKQTVPIKQPDGSFNDGPIGGFTFPNGETAMIYQCGKCGVLLKYNTGYNDHRKDKHGETDNITFGWADGPPKWKELDITEDMIIK